MGQFNITGFAFPVSSGGSSTPTGSPSDALLHSPADILRRSIILMELGVDPSSGTGSNWPVFTALEPNTPDNAVTTFDTDGSDFGRSQISGERFEHYGVQVRVRGKTHATGWAKAWGIATALDQTLYQQTVTIDGTSYFVHAVSRKSRVIALGKEPGTNRYLFTMNVTVNLHRIVT